MTSRARSRPIDRSDRKAISRRALLAGSGSLVAAAPVAARIAPAAAAPRDVREVLLPDSDHVRTYYRLARS